MTQFLGTLLKHLVSSIFISAILGFVTLTLMTGEFPPRLSRISDTFKSLRELENLQSRPLPANRTSGKKKRGRIDTDEAMLENLQAMNRKRASLGEKILGSPRGQLAKDPDPPSAGEHLREPAAADAKTVYEMQLHMSRMQNEIDQIKAQLRQTAAKR